MIGVLVLGNWIVAADEAVDIYHTRLVTIYNLPSSATSAHLYVCGEMLLPACQAGPCLMDATLCLTDYKKRRE